MEESNFGKLLREKRVKYGKTQECLAELIGKNKMLISNMEKGKNNPPRGKDLDNMIDALGLDDKERKEFQIEAALERGTLPNEIINRVKEDKRILEILYEINKSKFTNQKYKKIIEILRG